MTTKHIIGLTALAAASALSIAAVAAPTAAFDPRKCSAIENVDVPYDVGFDSGRIAFRSGGRQIVVAPSWMEVDGHRFADTALSPAYYQHVRGFLQAAGTFPKTAAAFGKSVVLPGHADARQNFLSGITSMCHSILNLADDQKRMHSSFAEFRAPVEITLTASQRL